MTNRSLNDEIQAEADRILDSGLRTLLAEYGQVHVVGSYALRLMTWKDLDIHVVHERRDIETFFRLGGRIAALLCPHRMHFRDECVVQTPDLPRGFYWGVYLGDERRGAWKIDIWQTDRQGFESVRRYSDGISGRLDEATRQAILTIKEVCWQHPEYRRGFTSADVYSAVLDGGVRDIRGFWAYLKARKGVTAEKRQTIS
jgi:hypothetical protein